MFKTYAEADILPTMVIAIFIGVVFLMGDSFGKYGITIFTSMAKLLETYWFGLLLQVIFVYGGALLLFAGMNPLKFLKDAAPGVDLYNRNLHHHMQLSR